VRLDPGLDPVVDDAGTNRPGVRRVTSRAGRTWALSGCPSALVAERELKPLATLRGALEDAGVATCRLYGRTCAASWPSASSRSAPNRDSPLSIRNLDRR
jgi:hypothetical protein